MLKIGKKLRRRDRARSEPTGKTGSQPNQVVNNRLKRQDAHDQTNKDMDIKSTVDTLRRPSIHMSTLSLDLEYDIENQRNVEDLSRQEDENKIQSTKWQIGHFLPGTHYHKLRKSKSEEMLPSVALNISVEDTYKERFRGRSKTAKLEMAWKQHEDKYKRRMALCENTENEREGFSKIVESYIIKRNMDDYGFLD